MEPFAQFPVQGTASFAAEGPAISTQILPAISIKASQGVANERHNLSRGIGCRGDGHPEFSGLALKKGAKFFPRSKQ